MTKLDLLARVVVVLFLVVLGLGIYLVTFPIATTHPSNLEPSPPPYTWYRVNPEANLTCLIVEAQYAQHPIGLWCERLP